MLLSVKSLVGQTSELPDFAEGYNEWKQAWDQGKAGYFTIEIKEAIDGVDQAMQPKK